jgi:predicted transcriptional regulator
MEKLLLISIKGKYVEEIVAGRKTIELRKSMPNVKAGDKVVIYTTRPRMAITAIATVKNVFKISPENMWQKNSQLLGIDKKSFWDYYTGCQFSIGIELHSVVELDTEISLSTIKLLHPGFTPPQTFKYLSKFKSFREYKFLQPLHS